MKKMILVSLLVFMVLMAGNVLASTYSLRPNSVGTYTQWGGLG